MAKTQENKKRHMQEYYKMLLFLNESTNDYFFLWDMEENLFYFARNILTSEGKEQDGMYEYSFEQLIAWICEDDRESLRSILEEIKSGRQEHFNLDFRYLDENKRKSWISCRGDLLQDDARSPFLMMGCLSRRELSEKVDMLTGLLNYNSMLENLTGSIARGKCGHLMVLGIDDFGDMNQRMGRDYGNHILRSVADILEETVNEKCRVYRMDGDHFGVELEGYSRRETSEFFHTLQMKTESVCNFSAGAVYYPYEEQTESNILAAYGENALKRAKKSGKNKMLFFSSEDYNENISRMELSEELRSSIRNNFEGFELFYQPQVTSNEYCLHGAEALLRYHSPKFGFMSPAVFIPILEQTEMMIPVGKWVLKQALSQCARWRKKYGEFHISINVSYVQLKENGFIQEVLKMVEESGVPGNEVTLEITESMQLQDYNYYNSIFYYWRKKGIHISIDDFGTGYSSLGYLKSLEVDEVKIDRCFIRQIHKSMYNYRLLNNMLDLTRNAQIRVCCEGVEEEEELRCLDTLFPELIQGFLFGKPVSAEEFEQTFLRSESVFASLVKKLKRAQEEAGRSGEALPGEVSEEERLEYKAILDNMSSVIYVVDTESLEILYMNSEAKKMTGTYNYFGCKCYQIFMGGKEPCPDCEKRSSEEAAYVLSKMFYESYGRKMLVHEKLLKWQNRNLRLVSALPVDGEDGSLDEKLNQDFYAAEGIIQLYELVLQGEKNPAQIDKVLRFTGQYYQADRVSLFLYDQEREIWQDVAAYHDQGVMDKERYLELTTADKMKTWADYVDDRQAVYIRDRNVLKEVDEVLYRGYLYQDINNCMLCAVRRENRLVAILVVDNPDYLSDKMALLKKSAFLIEQLLFCTEDKADLRKKLHKMVEKKLDHSILSVSALGLWQMKIDKRKKEIMVLADKNMKKNLGIMEELSPVECYQRWKNGIEEENLPYVRRGLERAYTSEETFEIEYPWIHPQRGKITLRCVGTKTAESDVLIVLEGYCRILEDMNRLRL